MFAFCWRLYEKVVWRVRVLVGRQTERVAIVAIRNCPTREELSSYVQGGLPEELTEAVAEHIETCVICDATLDELERQGNSLFRGLRHPVPPRPELDSPEYQRAMEAAEAAGLGGGASVTPPVAEPSLSELGRLGEYELLMKLGDGGMGTVYKARQVRLGKIVALKVLASERTRDPRAVARFENEMKAIGQLSHPNIVQAHDARDIEGTTVLVMEYVDGVDLAKLVQRAGPLPIADACELIRQTAVGLQYIHENHLVHRDIKPSNLMLTPQGQVKILDLGLALLGSDQTAGKEVTSNGLAMGTPDYIAPEQADDSHRVDIRADIYSLGCTLYHLLTGRAPFSGPNYKTPLNKVMGHARDTVPTVKKLRAEHSRRVVWNRRADDGQGAGCPVRDAGGGGRGLGAVYCSWRSRRSVGRVGLAAPSPGRRCACSASSGILTTVVAQAVNPDCCCRNSGVVIAWRRDLHRDQGDIWLYAGIQKHVPRGARRERRGQETAGRNCGTP